MRRRMKMVKSVLLRSVEGERLCALARAWVFPAFDYVVGFDDFDTAAFVVFSTRVLDASNSLLSCERRVVYPRHSGLLDKVFLRCEAPRYASTARAFALIFDQRVQLCVTGILLEAR